MRSNDSQKIIVVGVPKTLDDAQLSDLFSDFGAVAEAKVVLDAATNASRGFGFVTFTAGSAMRAAIKGMDKKVVQGRTLHVRQLVPKDQFQEQKKETPDASQRPCWLLRKGKCSKGANCPFSHDIKDGDFGKCFEFVQTGECKRGDKCKFSHPQEEKDAEGEEEEEEKQEVQEKKENSKPAEKRVCYSFQNGRCHRGKKCLYLHKLLEKESAPVKDKKKHEKTEKKEKVKESFEVVNKQTEAGKKRRRPDDEENDSDDEVAVDVKTEKVKAEKPLAAAGLAAHMNNFMASQKPVSKKLQQPKQQKPTQHSAGPKKFEWKAKAPTGNWKHEREQNQEQRQDEEVHPRPVKKVKKEKVDMGAAFDGVSDDEATPSRGGKKRKVDKETLRANREKLKKERRAKRSAKKTALSKLLTKGEVELEA
ncbi:hypothetical protein PF005_g29180 [Phytophthora fragariae]|uniref:Zinc finger CCCH domain-containing protein 42 n=1 Tax=Phytophthora fragariae TaxID=53985 RepID=A0A6A3DP08_9STRA|nr:hypothetical protein PF003_g1823 [Phytophthora fragariae]KAE8920070.1 hypothetical protein PF009_g29631 [Phytophthora fragariae]KAE8965267.1 hypothetical protein PF011_g28362 [Phytophthora fragariae]KAE9064841.1 hypothetical protein PF007_g29050 [Phytophthora fragariae]KAE9071304.1 hypothetical protein PF010_g25919 [Phytophthora fragariae]